VLIDLRHHTQSFVPYNLLPKASNFVFSDALISLGEQELYTL